MGKPSLTKAKHGSRALSEMSPASEEIVGITIPPITETLAHAKGAHFEFRQVAQDILAQQNLRLPNVASFIEDLNLQLASRRLSDQRCKAALDGHVLRPLSELLHHILELHEQVKQADAVAVHGLYVAQAQSEGEKNFEKMRAAFFDMLSAIERLNTEDKKHVQEAEAALVRVNALAKQASGLAGKIKERENALDGLIRQTNRELNEGSPILATKIQLETRWQELENQLSLCIKERQQLSSITASHAQQARQFYVLHDSLIQYEGEWRRQKSVVERAEAFFVAAQLKPFELVGLERADYMEMPGTAARQNVVGAVPDNPPKLEETTINERQRMVCTAITQALDELENRSGSSAPPVPKPNPVPPALPKQTPQAVSANALHIVVAAFAAKGGPHKPDVLFECLQQLGLTGGNSAQKLRDALSEAVTRSLVLRDGRSGKCQTSPNGQSTAQACNWYNKVPNPADFFQLLGNQLAKTPVKSVSR